MKYPGRMGIHLSLHVMPGSVQPERWRQIYDEVLGLLAGHPSRLLGIDWREVGGVRLAVHTTSIERTKAASGARELCVVGDLTSKRTAESFVLPRELAECLRCQTEAPGGPDVLLCLPDVCDDDGPCAPDLFGGKTQGRPFHIPLLAAAMVVESGLPGTAAVGGDVGLEDAREARTWAEAVLGREVELPVRLDAPRLLRRLAPHLSGPALVRKARQVQLGEDREELLGELCACADQELIEAWYLDDVRLRDEDEAG
jgi:hypothetical protein